MTAVLAALLSGAFIYTLLSILAALRYLGVRPKKDGTREPISVLKPLSGLDSGLELNLRTFFEQNSPTFEILFAVRDPADPSIAVVEQLQREYPHVPSRLLVT